MIEHFAYLANLDSRLRPKLYALAFQERGHAHGLLHFLCSCSLRHRRRCFLRHRRRRRNRLPGAANFDGVYPTPS